MFGLDALETGWMSSCPCYVSKDVCMHVRSHSVAETNFCIKLKVNICLHDCGV